jgi:hypothetical protein
MMNSQAAKASPRWLLATTKTMRSPGTEAAEAVDHPHAQQAPAPAASATMASSDFSVMPG